MDTKIEPSTIEAALDNIIDPLRSDSIADAPLAGMATNSQLSLTAANRFMYRVDNTLPQWWLDSCSPAYTGTRTDKCQTQTFAEAEFAPFEFYDLLEVGCVNPILDIQQLTADNVSQATGWALTTEMDHAPATSVLAGGVRTGNPSLRSAVSQPDHDLTPASGKAVAPGAGLSALMRAMRQRGTARMTIHVPFEALPALHEYTSFVGGVLRGPGNLIINPGLGFTGVGPDITGNRDDTADACSYFYATRGAAQYRLGEVTGYSPEALIDHRTNTSIAESLRRAVVVFDPGATYCVKVCLNERSVCG